MWLMILLLLCVVFIVVASTKLNLHPFLSLLLAAIAYGVLCGRMTLEAVVKSVNDGFGGTVGYIGLVILAGSVIGTFLEKSDGAKVLAESILRLVGERHVPLAMAIIGYIVGVPVFCDSGFVILAPLCRALSRRAGTSLAAAAVALSLGLYSTHTMVPPTPGPLAAAGILKADLGLVIIWGGIVGIVAAAAGWVFAVKFAAKTHLSCELPPEAETAAAGQHDGPSALKAIIPILLPIILIILKSISDLPSHPLGDGRWAAAIRFVGQPVIALLAGVFFSFSLPKKLTKEMVGASGWVGTAVLSAATIIIITGCGGAFGKVLQNSGISDVVGRFLGEKSAAGILLPFAIAAALKTAQGSSTVAIITTSGIILPLLGVLGWESATARALAVVAIGAGSMVVSHVNDSYFWVVTQLSGMSVNQGYKLQTLGTLVEGLVSAAALWVIAAVVL